MRRLRPPSVAFVSTLPPRRCGLAAYTTRLISAVREGGARIDVQLVAIEAQEPPDGRPATRRPGVRCRIRQGDPRTYGEAAVYLNDAGVDVVCLQHEFGLYGAWGEPFDDHLVEFLAEVRRPLVTTLHTVLPDPSPSVVRAVRRLAGGSRFLVVMTSVAATLLAERYGVDRRSIRLIPHGAELAAANDRAALRRRLRLDGRSVVLTLGLVDPRKGVEHMIAGMKHVVRRHPEALYVVAGMTHPDLLTRSGEGYRTSLGDLARSEGLDGHVRFIDRYLSNRAFLDYLVAADVCVTPYLDPAQVTSGTLVAALGAGKAVVSTPYLHALEALGKGRGLLVGFADPAALGRAVVRVLDEPALRRDVERRAAAYARSFAWDRVGRRMLGVLMAAAGTT